MTKNSNIEWTTHTFNAWRGCTKVSAGCKHCYAETLSGRNPTQLGIWGKNGTRVIAAESYWREPLKWNKAAEKAGERHRVFCASLADVFEGAESMPAASVEPVRQARVRLFALIKATPALDWLLLTKRPENIRSMLPEDWGEGYPNVWLGTSVEDQAAANTRIPHLVNVPATVRFLSCEPLLGPVDLEEWFSYERRLISESCFHEETPIHWVIVGGESGGHARPMHPNWARSLQDQCTRYNVAFFFKQWGEWHPWNETTGPNPTRYKAGFFSNADAWHKGEINPFRCSMVCIGKKNAGRLLDGRVWDEIPVTE